MAKTIFITGASRGFGKLWAEAFLKRGDKVVATARDLNSLDDLVNQYGNNILPLQLDVNDRDEDFAAIKKAKEHFGSIDVLINNAGYGVPGTFDGNDWRTHEDFIRIMMEAPTELAWRLLPAMRARGYGRIINVASLAGHVPSTAGHTLYGASKAYLIKFSQALALENADRDVHVCALCPGFTWSEFHDVTGTRETMNKMPSFMWQTAEAVVAEGIEGVEAGDPVCVTGRVNRAIKAFAKLIPDWLGLWIMKRQAHRFRDTSRQAAPST